MDLLLMRFLKTMRYDRVVTEQLFSLQPLEMASAPCTPLAAWIKDIPAEGADTDYRF